MKVDLDEFRRNFDSQLEKIEKRQAYLEQQLEHLAVVQKLAEREPIEKSKDHGLHISDFRHAIFGGDR